MGHFDEGSRHRARRRCSLSPIEGLLKSQAHRLWRSQGVVRGPVAPETLANPERGCTPPSQASMDGPSHRRAPFGAHLPPEAAVPMSNQA